MRNYPQQVAGTAVFGDRRYERTEERLELGLVEHRGAAPSVPDPVPKADWMKRIISSRGYSITSGAGPMTPGATTNRVSMPPAR
jgi:hypothetical protein